MVNGEIDVASVLVPSLQFSCCAVLGIPSDLGETDLERNGPSLPEVPRCQSRRDSGLCASPPRRGRLSPELTRSRLIQASGNDVVPSLCSGLPRLGHSVFSAEQADAYLFSEAARTRPYDCFPIVG
ncbi:hypothetical protein DPEC_G00235700 [Dallia pectoralis]|uniref:Uncharacterized protein n=1 Tax=Dallia pectoralis TaxID=75939 RepID=A0ACC2FYE6_DALPE|nr:hypothetical protein DPEC_G00235700 [Dallia pectoralis]